MKPYDVFRHGPRAGEPKTLTDRVIRFLVEAKGMVEVDSRSRYRQFVEQANPPRRFFIGSAGAVRTGKNASASVSITEEIHQKMKEWEERQLAEYD